MAIEYAMLVAAKTRWHFCVGGLPSNETLLFYLYNLTINAQLTDQSIILLVFFLHFFSLFIVFIFPLFFLLTIGLFLFSVDCRSTSGKCGGFSCIICDFFFCCFCIFCLAIYDEIIYSAHSERFLRERAEKKGLYCEHRIYYGCKATSKRQATHGIHKSVRTVTV